MPAKNQTKDKRACVDCHFISISQLKWEVLSVPTATEGHYPFGNSEREQARRNEDITLEEGGRKSTLSDCEFVLTCWKKCWTEFDAEMTKKLYGFIEQADRYRLIVETDRSNCPYFFKYMPTMPFEIAEEYRKEVKLLQSTQSDDHNNHEDDANLEGKSLFIDGQNNILYFDKENFVSLKPEEIKLIQYMCKQASFQLKQILIDHFNTKQTEGSSTICKDERNLFDSYKSSINKKCKELGIEDLIVKHGSIKKAFKLSVNIKKRIMSL